jgi:hypothetical protein
MWGVWVLCDDRGGGRGGHRLAWGANSRAEADEAELTGQTSMSLLFVQTAE